MAELIGLAGGTEEVAEKEEKDVVEEAAEEEEEEEIPQDPDFYDSKKSFFDNISCEALEKEQGRNRRANWKKERETNVETFGQSAVRSYNYRRGLPLLPSPLPPLPSVTAVSAVGGGGRGFGRGGYYRRGARPFHY